MAAPREAWTASGALWLGAAAAAGLSLACYALRSSDAPRRKASVQDATDFDSFLKQPVAAAPPHNPTDFTAFLKSAAAAQPPSAPAPVAQQPGGAAGADAGPCDGDAVVTVLFGSEYGFSQEVAEKAAARLRQLQAPRLWVQLLNMADYPSGLPIEREQLLLVFCSTQGDGVPPTEARDFCDWLHGSGAPTLRGTHFAVCALGDRSYVHFCRCGKQLDARLEALGGRRLVARVDVDKENWRAIDGWLGEVEAALPAAGLRTVAETGGHEREAPAPPAPKRWSKSRPFPARVRALEPLCAVQHAGDKNTYRVELDIEGSGLAYTAGDAVGIYPRNDPCYVDELLHVAGYSGKEEVAAPSWRPQPPQPEADAATEQRLTLRAALIECYDLRAPKPELLQLLVDSARPAAHANGHANGYTPNGHTPNGNTPNGHTPNGSILTNGAPANSPAPATDCHTDARAGIGAASGPSPAPALPTLLALGDQGALEAYLEARHVVDLLREFPGCRPPPAALLASLRPLAPRLYSISSAPCEARGADGGPAAVHATVAVVRYESLGRPRVGVASTFCAERLQEGESVPCYIAPNPEFRLPPSPATPIIMVGPGTGIAPFRAFILERIAAAANPAVPAGPALLFFGCRRRDQDFLYGDLLEAWAAAGRLELYTAFSREQARKVYVQDRLREAGGRLFALLQQGAHFYVCGDAGSMAAAVDAALLDVVQAGLGGGPRSRAEAEAYVDALRCAGRYQRDVW